MKPEFNYESVPFDFSHCFCGQCKVADKCLRYQVALRIPESRYSVPVINPNNVSPDGENCRYFKADRMAVYGLGISRMFDDLKGDCGQKTGILLFRAKHVLPDSS